MHRGGGKSNEELRIKNEELSASQIKKQGSAAEGKANYRIKKQRLSDEGKANEELSASPNLVYKSQRSENNSTLLTLNSKFEFQGTIRIKRKSKDLANRKATVKTLE